MQSWSFASRREVPNLASPSTAIVPPSLLLPILLLPLILATSSYSWFALALSFAAAFTFLLALSSAFFPRSFARGLLQRGAPHRWMVPEANSALVSFGGVVGTCERAPGTRAAGTPLKGGTQLLLLLIDRSSVLLIGV